MFDRLKAAATEMDAALAEIEPNGLIGTQPAAGIELLTRHERKVAAARTRLTARAAEMNHWQRLGFRCLEDWLAATTGTSPGQAKRRTRAAKNMADHDDITDALADGDISEDEADVVADAAAKNPQAKKELLDTARNKNKTHKDLKDKAAKAKAAGEDDRARAERLRQGRTATWGPDRDGFWGLSGRLQPHVGAEVKSRLQAEVDRRFNQARRDGRREPSARYRADALAALILGHDPDTAAARAPTSTNDRHTNTTDSANADDTGPTADRGHRRTEPGPDDTDPGLTDSDNTDKTDNRDHDGHRSDDPSPAGPKRTDDEPIDDSSVDDGPIGDTPGVDNSAGGAGPSTGGERRENQVDSTGDRGEPDSPNRRPTPARVGKEMVLDINLETLRRGCVNPGETCTIRGVGPVPVEIARRWADDAFIKAVIRDGVDIHKVAHYGRHIPIHLRTALDLIDTTCAVPNCDNPTIEYDHDHPYAHGGVCSGKNLRPLCPPHHDQRTNDGYELTGPPADRQWHHPDGRILAADDPTKVDNPQRAP
jgi:hypothetical protein